MDSNGGDTHAQRTSPSTAHIASSLDDTSDWSDDATISSLKPAARLRGQRAQAVPLWARRLSQREKLLRGSAVALAALVVLVLIITIGPPAQPSHPSTVPPDSFSQVTALVAHSPVPLPASPWEQIALPPSSDVSWSIAPVTSEPSTIFACATSSGAQANGAARQSPVALWRSHDTGAHWQPVAIALTGSACSIQAVSDTHGYVAVLAEGYIQQSAAQGNCASMNAFFSRDGGDTWVPVQTQEQLSTAGVAEYCAFFITPHHLYFWHYYSNGLNLASGQHTFLERSDDGATWIRADSGLSSDAYFYPTFLSGSDDDAVIASVPAQHGNISGVTLWRSKDGGGHWQHFGDTERYANLVASQESSANRSDLVSRILYGLVPNALSERVYALRVLQSSDGQHWMALPMLPVEGATPDHIGVLETLGVTSGGKLLFFGADPHAGIPHAGSDSSIWRGDAQWLWAWDPHAQRWEIPQTPLRVPWPPICAQQCWQSHLAWGLAPNGTGYGTYVWIMRKGDTMMYRAFIPAT